MTPPFRSGYVCIVGQPNVGKSTLLNAILGARLSIVSARPQTTRLAIRGILNEPGLQIVFIDTPGWLVPKDAYQGVMKNAINFSMHDDADALVWLVEPRAPDALDIELAARLKRLGKPLVVAINKIDMPGASPAAAEQGLARELPGVPVFHLSARTKQGVTDLKKHMAGLLTGTEAYFPTDQMTDRWERFFAAEIIREQMLNQFDDEVPHACYVHVEEFEEQQGRKDRIKAVLYVETEGQKRIVIGAAGDAIKRLGSKARAGIETLTGRPVFLELVVKVEPHWRKNTGFIKKMQESGS